MVDRFPSNPDSENALDSDMRQLRYLSVKPNFVEFMRTRYTAQPRNQSALFIYEFHPCIIYELTRSSGTFNAIVESISAIRSLFPTGFFGPLLNAFTSPSVECRLFSCLDPFGFLKPRFLPLVPGRAFKELSELNTNEPLQRLLKRHIEEENLFWLAGHRSASCVGK